MTSSACRRSSSAERAPWSGWASRTWSTTLAGLTSTHAPSPARLGGVGRQVEQPLAAAPLRARPARPCARPAAPCRGGRRSRRARGSRSGRGPRRSGRTRRRPVCGRRARRRRRACRAAARRRRRGRRSAPARRRRRGRRAAAGAARAAIAASGRRIVGHGDVRRRHGVSSPCRREVGEEALGPALHVAAAHDLAQPGHARPALVAVHLDGGDDRLAQRVARRAG